GVLSGEHAIVLHLSGRPYGDKPPLWFGFVAAIEKATGLPIPSAFFLASALAAFAFAWGTCALARRAGASPATSLLAGLFALSTPVVAVLAQNTRMDLAFSILVVASEALAISGLSREQGNGRTVAAGAVALAALGVKGPLGVVLPFVAAVAWLAW